MSRSWRRDFSWFGGTFTVVVVVVFIVMFLLGREPSGPGLTMIIGAASLVAGFVAAAAAHVVRGDEER